MKREEAEKLIRKLFDAERAVDPSVQTPADTDYRFAYEEVIEALAPPSAESGDANIDYWANIMNDPTDQTDPLAKVLNFIKSLEHVAPILNMLAEGAKDAADQISKSREQIVKESMNKFSDICSMLDAHAIGDEGAYEVCRRLIKESSRLSGQNEGDGVKEANPLFRPGHEALLSWFGLSYASFCVMPRVMMEDMPDEWQGKIAKLLNQYDETFPNQPDIEARVQITAHGKLIKTPEWMLNYRHPDRSMLISMKEKLEEK